MRRLTLISPLLAVLLAVVWAGAREPADTPSAAQTRKKLHEKVTVDYSSTPLSEVVDDLKGQVRRLTILIDHKGGVSKNTTITYQANDQPLEKVLNGICDKAGLGYVVISEKGNAYDGSLLIKQGKERGYPLGEEPRKAVAGKETGKSGKAMKKDQPKGKTANGEGEGKAAARKKAEPKSSAADDPDEAEREAQRRLGFARTLAEDGRTARAKDWLERIIKDYPKTHAAQEARTLLDKLNKPEKSDKP